MVKMIYITIILITFFGCTSYNESIISGGNIQEVKKINTLKNAENDNYLYFAASINDIELMKYLIKVGKRENSIRKLDIRKIILIAIENENIEILSYILDEEMETFGSNDNNIEYLIKAMEFNSYNSFKVLLEKGLDINEFTENQENLLYIAYNNNNIEFFDYLLLNNADVNIYKGDVNLLILSIIIKNDIKTLNKINKYNYNKSKKINKFYSKKALAAIYKSIDVFNYFMDFRKKIEYTFDLYYDGIINDYAGFYYYNSLDIETGDKFFDDAINKYEEYKIKAEKYLSDLSLYLMVKRSNPIYERKVVDESYFKYEGNKIYYPRMKTKVYEYTKPKKNGYVDFLKKRLDYIDKRIELINEKRKNIKKLLNK